MDEQYPELNSTERAAVLRYLGCTAEKPSVAALNRLIDQYTQRVPWESVFRITKRAVTDNLADRPRWPAEFWAAAIERGGGGTCYESNYAFFSLLRSLGYEGYLTVNNMGETVGCHTAIVLQLVDRQQLVDVGIPLHRSMPIKPGGVQRTPSTFHGYVVRADGEQRYQIERTRHPKRNIFTLLDQPVNNADYRIATTNDYRETGLFLDRVHINKIVDGHMCRFSSGDKPWQIEKFDAAGNKQTILLTAGQEAHELGAFFGMAAAIIAQALAVVT